MREYDYLKRLGKSITNGAVRGEIIEEYKAHLEDAKAALLEKGMTEKEAEEEAVRQMGDPEETGNELNQVHGRIIDFGMFWWMMAFAFIVPVFEVITRAITSGEYGIVELMKEDMYMQDVPNIVNVVIGSALMCYGIALCVWEKYRGKNLFYAYGRNWKGNYLTNSGTVMAIAAFFLSVIVPIKGFTKPMVAVFLAMIVNLAIRTIMNLLCSKREQKYLWEVGIADTEIFYKGKGTICGKEIKARAKASEDGTRIQAGTPIMVVGMEGFKPVVISI